MDELIEKVKQGLRCCLSDDMENCDNCEYNDHCFNQDEELCGAIMADALSVIEQMEQEIARLKKTEAEKQEERKRNRQAYMKKYRSEHKEQAYQELKEWRKNNPEKWKAQKARERQRKNIAE